MVICGSLIIRSALKNKKAGVEDAITRASREIERLHIPQVR